MKRILLSALVAAFLSGGNALAADLWKKAAPAAGEPLSAESAFQLVSAERSGDTVKLEWVIAPGYYLYRKRLAFEPVAPTTAKVGTAVLPKGKTIHDEHFGDVEVYRETLSARLPLTPTKAVLTQLRVRFQGCADAGVCYPPVTRVVDLAAAVP